MSENHTPETGTTLWMGNILILVVLIAGVWWSYQHYLKPDFETIQKNRKTISLLQQDIKRLHIKNKQLKIRITALKANDPIAWEEATRMYLGWVKPGEIIVEQIDK